MFFLDKDGVINMDNGYVYKISDCKLYNKVGEAIEYLNKNNFIDYFFFILAGNID